MEEIPRYQYLAELDEWRDETGIVKVILGVRRSGKSVVMANTVGDCLNLMFHQKTWLYDNLSSTQIIGEPRCIKFGFYNPFSF